MQLLLVTRTDLTCKSTITVNSRECFDAEREREREKEREKERERERERERRRVREFYLALALLPVLLAVAPFFTVAPLPTQVAFEEENHCCYLHLISAGIVR